MSEKVEYVKRLCRYEYSENELKEISQTLALKNQQTVEVEAEKKAVMASYKERLERLQADINTASRIVRDGFDMRDIECAVERDFDAGEIRYIRTDTGQVAGTDKMTMADRQLRIDDFIN